MTVKNTLFSTLAITALLLATATFAASPATACSPPIYGWQLIEILPDDGAEDAPLNGVLTVRAGFIDETERYVWPDEDTIDRSVRLTLTRGEDEIVPGVTMSDPDARELRFVSELPLAEGIAYTLRVEFDNADLNLPGEFIDEDRSVTFVTGTRFDEAPPAFSGVQNLVLTQHADPVQDCCEAPEDYCVGMCTFPCNWCWTVDWEYPPKSEITFRAIEDEFGPRTVSYLVYRVSGPDDEALGEPVVIRRVSESGEHRVSLVSPLDDPGPFCYRVQAVDAYGRRDANSTVLCRSLDEIVTIDRVAVPPEDRSNCAGESEDVGVDVGMDAGGEPDVEPEDTGVTPDVPDNNEDENPQVITTPGDDGGCGCQTPAAPRSGAPLGLLLLVAALFVGSWRRGG